MTRFNVAMNAPGMRVFVGLERTEIPGTIALNVCKFLSGWNATFLIETSDD